MSKVRFFISGFDEDTDDDFLRRKLARYGKVINIKIRTNSAAKRRSAAVEMETAEGMETMLGLRGEIWRGHEIKLRNAPRKLEYFSWYKPANKTSRKKG